MLLFNYLVKILIGIWPGPEQQFSKDHNQDLIYILPPDTDTTQLYIACTNSVICRTFVEVLPRRQMRIFRAALIDS